jgi:hypothetical protein
MDAIAEDFDLTTPAAFSRKYRLLRALRNSAEAQGIDPLAVHDALMALDDPIRSDPIRSAIAARPVLKLR